MRRRRSPNGWSASAAGRGRAIAFSTSSTGPRSGRPRLPWPSSPASPAEDRAAASTIGGAAVARPLGAAARRRLLRRPRLCLGAAAFGGEGAAEHGFEVDDLLRLRRLRQLEALALELRLDEAAEGDLVAVLEMGRVEMALAAVHDEAGEIHHLGIERRRLFLAVRSRRSAAPSAHGLLLFLLVPLRLRR